MLFAALVLFITSGKVYFSLILLLYGAVLKFLIKDPVITINENGVSLKNIIGITNYPWSGFGNVIIKDGLLSLDFKNNKIKYFSIAENVNENEFNSFCSKYLQ